MRLFAGLSRTDYEEVFRAIGALLDERGWSNVALMEVEEGLVLQGTPRANYQEKPRLEVYLLTDSDVEGVMRDALTRRQAAALAGRQLAPARAETNHRAAAPVAPAVDDTDGAEQPPGRTAAQAARGTAEEEPADDWRNRPGDLPLPSFEEQLAPKELLLDEPEEPEEPDIDVGAARAAVVMAHIVAARLKSGIPLTGDDPDLRSLLDQVQALDKSGIGSQ